MMSDLHDIFQNMTIEAMDYVRSALSFKKVNYYVFGLVCIGFIKLWLSLDLSNQPIISVYNSGVLTIFLLMASFILLLKIADSILFLAQVMNYLWLIFDSQAFLQTAFATVIISWLWLFVMKVAIRVSDDV